jgi:hypothetical protein
MAGNETTETEQPKIVQRFHSCICPIASGLTVPISLQRFLEMLQLAKLL